MHLSGKLGCNNVDWDDYRYFAAIAQHGSVRGAAQGLGVNASTVTRRLEQLETTLGVSLFKRSNRGLAITTEGVEVAQLTEQIAAKFRAMEAAIQGRDQRVAGRIRVVVPDALATRLLLPELSVFTESYPDIDLQLMPGYQAQDPGALVASDVADIVIRATDHPPEAMIGRRIARVALAAFASHEFIARYDEGRIPATSPWVDWTGSGEIARRYQELRATHFPDVKVAIRCDQIEMQRAALQSSIGIGLLPCFVGNADSRLVRLKQMPIVAGPTLWVLTHPASRSVRRIQLCLAFLRDTLAGHAQALAEGITEDVSEYQ